VRLAGRNHLIGTAGETHGSTRLAIAPTAVQGENASNNPNCDRGFLETPPGAVKRKPAAISRRRFFEPCLPRQS
jgi:hypothetical protein